LIENSSRALALPSQMAGKLECVPSREKKT
jgi:hypothetical protein